jgi:hypothetical protein
MGFPHLVFMNAAGDVVAEHNGDRTVESMRNTGKLATNMLDLRKKFAAGDKSVEVKLFLAELELGAVEFFDAEEKAKTLKFTAQQQTRFDSLMLDLEVMELFEFIRTDPSQMQTVGKKFYDRLAAGKKPSSTRSKQIFYSLIMGWAQEQNHADAFEAALTEMKVIYKDEPRAVPQLKAAEETLKKMRS